MFIYLFALELLLKKAHLVVIAIVFSIVAPDDVLENDKEEHEIHSELHE